MPGGLMNLVSEGQGNILLNGNPTKTFFKTKYAKYTNFGLQKFRVDFEGAKTLRLSEESTFDFKIPRYADLLMDTYITITMPDIWSPILPPQTTSSSGVWVPYEFKWIENLGTKMISKITVNCGNQKLGEYSGNYLMSLVQRDWKNEKKQLYDTMTGNTPQFNNPAYYGQNGGNYPNAYYTSDTTGPQPSILGKTLFVPINLWFVVNSAMAFPLVSLQYNELHIYVTFRPICELFTIRDVYDEFNNYPEVAPNFNLFYMQMYRFLQPPPDTQLGINSYTNLKSIWNADIHLNCTYAFLSNDEQRLFAMQEQKYLIKQVHERVYRNITGPNRVDLDSVGMISNWLFYFQRSDVNLRNQWSNYTNFPYSVAPVYIQPAPTTGSEPFTVVNDNVVSTIGPGINMDGYATGLYTTNLYSVVNNPEILTNLAIVFDGEYRENMQHSGVYNYIEKYTRTPSNGNNYLYCYNFSLQSDMLWVNSQPSGAINMSRFNNIQFEFNTIIPPLDLLAQSLNICDPNTGQIIGVNKQQWDIYQYNYDLYLFEERINMVVFIGGNASVLYAL